MIQKTIFLSLVSIVLISLSYYFYVRVSAFFIHNKKIRLTFFTLLLTWQLGYVAANMFNTLWDFRGFLAASLGVSFFIFVYSLLLEAAVRVKFFNFTKYVILSLFFISVVVSIQNVKGEPNIKTVQIDNSPKELKGLKGVLLTDLHIDPSKGEFADLLVSSVNGLNPDMVFIGGDICDGVLDDVRGNLSKLAHIRSAYGVYYAPGNHEYYYGDFDQKMYFLSALGFNVLVNSNTVVNAKNGSFGVVGLSDLAAKRVGLEEPNQQKGFFGLTKPSILISHQPKSALDAKPYHPFLTLSGHTHNGQIWPFGYLVSLVQPFVYGEYEFAGGKIVVSSGCGVWGPPMRLFTDSEIVVLEFK